LTGSLSEKEFLDADFAIGIRDIAGAARSSYGCSDCGRNQQQKYQSMSCGRFETSGSF